MFATLFWKKAWIWLKHHWYWPVIIVLLIFSVAAGSSSREKLFGLMAKQKESYEKELQIVKEAAQEVDKKKTEIFASHLDELKRIEKEHDVKIEELEIKKQEELVATIEENKDSPAKLAEEISKILSAEYLKNR